MKKGENIMILINNNVKEATYTSVWDGGIEVTSRCKINIKTREIFDFEMVSVSGLEVLEREYVTMDESKYKVNEESTADTYWYQ